MFGKFFKKWGKAAEPIAAPLSYEDAKSLARDGTETVRAGLAERTDVEPEILYFLAEDPSPRVRGLIAANTAAPRQADLLLAKDSDVDVRGSLAEKIVRLAPGLSSSEQNRLRATTYEALALLARDQAVRVRQILADALREVADAPPEVIRQLAWDVEAAVATPVLRFSPVLTDQDLIAIIQAKPSSGSVAAISQRSHVSSEVSDEIISSNDIEAIALLLGNHSAQIREQTLDKVLTRAVDVDQWHMPLAMRPKLPRAVAVKISRFVADDILRRMADRHDLDSDTLAAVRDVVHKRLGEEPGHAGRADNEIVATGVNVDDDDVFDYASKLWAEGKLNEPTFVVAAKSNRKLAMAMLSVMADLPLHTIEQAFMNKSSKGCMALAWRAGLTPVTAEIIQQRLAGISVTNTLRAAGQKFPMTEQELSWQIDFLQQL